MRIQTRRLHFSSLVTITTSLLGGALMADDDMRGTTKPAAAKAATPKRIMPVGDSITRGSYLGLYKDGPYNGQIIGLPGPEGGGWRKPLQDKLRAAGVAFDFVGALDYMAYGKDGKCDKEFDPEHHGLAGFGNRDIRLGGKPVPSAKDVLDAKGVKEIIAPDIITALKQYKPDVVLLMSGANGFDAKERDLLIQTIVDNFTGHLIVAAITPQCAPRAGWEQVGEYNASLPKVVAELIAKGRRVSMVDMNAALTNVDLLPDGVHPNREGMEKIAGAWWSALYPVLKGRGAP